MTLVGLSWLQLIGIGAALAAGVVLIYLLKLKRRGLLVASSLLWRQVLDQKRAESWLERLRWWLSLLLQLAFAMLIVAALAQPKLTSQIANERWTVLILDASASMQARSSNQSRQTRFDLARAATADLIENLSGNESLLLLQLGGSNTTLAAFTTDRQQLHAALNQAQATEAPADLLQAINLANEALAGRPNPRIVLASDGALSPEVLAASAIKPTLLRVGEPVDNVGITALSVRKPFIDAPDYQLYLEVGNFSETPQSCNVKIYQADELIDTRPIDLAARGKIQKVYSDFAPQGGQLRIELDVDDGLALDNRAFAYLPPRRGQRGLLVTEGNIFLESALTADPTLEITKVRPAQFNEQAEVDFIVFDEVTPKYTGRAHTVYLNPSGEFSPVATVGELRETKVSEHNSDHPLLRYVSFKDLVIKRAPQLRAGADDLVLARAGSDPIIVVRDDSGRRIVVIAGDTALREQSDLPLRAAFPILLANTIHWFAGERSDEVALLPIGQAAQLKRADGTARLSGPDGRQTPLAPDGVFMPTQVGFYEMKAPGETQVLSVNLVSAAESDVLVPSNLEQIVDKLAATGRGFASRPIWFYLVLVGLAIATLEWFTYQRRITV